MARQKREIAYKVVTRRGRHSVFPLLIKFFMAHSKLKKLYRAPGYKKMRKAYKAGDVVVDKSGNGMMCFEDKQSADRWMMGYSEAIGPDKCKVIKVAGYDRIENPKLLLFAWSCWITLFESGYGGLSKDDLSSSAVLGSVAYGKIKVLS